MSKVNLYYKVNIAACDNNDYDYLYHITSDYFIKSKETKNFSNKCFKKDNDLFIKCGNHLNKNCKQFLDMFDRNENFLSLYERSKIEKLENDHIYLRIDVVKGYFDKDIEEDMISFIDIFNSKVVNVNRDICNENKYNFRIGKLFEIHDDKVKILKKNVKSVVNKKIINEYEKQLICDWVSENYINWHINKICIVCSKCSEECKQFGNASIFYCPKFKEKK